MRQSVKQRLAALTNEEKSPSADVLGPALRDPNPAVRSKAVQLVAQGDVDALLPVVEELLSDADEKVRIDAVACLGSFAGVPRSARDKMLALLKDGSFLVRIETLESLALLHEYDALPAIAEFLSDGNALVRAYAARSIAALDGTSYISAIENTLRLEKQEVARSGLLEALFLLGQEGAFKPLLELLLSDDYRVRCAVANTLAEISMNRNQLELALAALRQAQQHAIAVADFSTVKRTLDCLTTEEKLG
jgi:HEAT repeat protein